LARLDADPAHERLVLERADALGQRARIAMVEGDCAAAVGDFDRAIALQRTLLEADAPSLAENLAGLAACDGHIGDVTGRGKALAEARAIARVSGTRNSRLRVALRSAMASP
jgi:lipopolysaccharide biosynthesis regulator YciM